MNEESDANMLDENQVIEGVCAFLKEKGYGIKSKCSTIERGIDICAENLTTGRTLYLEAKGATSSFEKSNRFGKPYTESQVYDRVSKGFYAVFRMKSMVRREASFALAVPDSKLFRKYLEPIKQVFEDAAIGVFVVSSQRGVRLFTDFQL
jgi:hypothetical protein